LLVLLPFDETAFGDQLAELDRLRTSLDASPLVIEWRSRLASDLIAEAVQASTSMEGIPVTVEEVRRILAGDKPATVSEENAALVTGYRNAMTYCQRRADDDVFTWSPELIKSIQDHVLAGRKDLGAGRYGRSRFVQDNRTGEVIFTPPQEGIANLVEELCSRMNGWAAHAALQSAWVHVALAAIHPFKDGNGRTARVLASLAMYRGKFNRPEFTSLEEWWGQHIVTYRNAFKCLGPVFDRNTDVTPFVATHVAAQVQQVYILQNVQNGRRLVFNGLAGMASKFDLPDRCFVALWEAFWDRVITRPYYASVSGVTPNTATKDLNLLVAARLLRAEGLTRGRIWRVGPEFFPLLGREFGLARDDSSHGAILSLVARQVVDDARNTERAAQRASEQRLHVATQYTLFPSQTEGVAVAATTASVNTDPSRVIRVPGATTTGKGF
jgi:Fic family protein